MRTGALNVGLVNEDDFEKFVPLLLKVWKKVLFNFTFFRSVAVSVMNTVNTFSFLHYLTAQNTVFEESKFTHRIHVCDRK